MVGHTRKYERNNLSIDTILKWHAARELFVVASAANPSPRYCQSGLMLKVRLRVCMRAL